ncbi:glutamine---fructose-6-phosphate transaminase (isomerizing) [Synchytrium microbalum]|uniref:glutamine--fructose-6-phosphate transaminase (isomerizing) n=1 Tax=Synchytrium microbalum TaxID=1806994 RepID=A0A507BW64_9FUNG|nr:glutamine---fructose-6-phosphate transaminase (isomerizing) [Synchytrium microbalum]TPX33087.1 glutamine---fructose-6-phosphate transaminase (isomerizing) [Synchytrium microbalum]
MEKNVASQYDSCGLAIDGDDDESTLVYKQVGPVSTKELKQRIMNLKELDLTVPFISHVAISHKRWATHGKPGIVNTHPLRSDARSEFVIAHNGIITNHRELKESLSRRGISFDGDTDSEVIAKLCKYVYDAHTRTSQQNQLQQAPTLPDIMKAVLRQIEGSFALVVKSKKFPHEMIAARRGSPLMIGVKSSKSMRVDFVESSELGDVADDEEGEGSDDDGFLPPETPPRLRRTVSRSFLSQDDLPQAAEYFISSDGSAIVEHTRQVLTLEDDDIAHFTEGELHIHRLRRDQEDAPIIRQIQTLELELAQIQKGSFEHYFQKEIHEQVEAVTNVMRGRVDTRSGRLVLGGLIKHMANITRSRRIVMCGSGSSYHACLATKSLFSELLDIPCSVDLPSTLIDENLPIFRDDVVILVSHSGETRTTIDALAYCKERGALCLGVTNTVGSTISRDTHCGLHVHSGPDVSVASNKAFTSEIVGLILIAVFLSEDRGQFRARRTEIIQALDTLPSKMQQVLALEGQIKSIAQRLVGDGIEHLLMVGRGQIATCMEGAWTAKRAARVHAEAIPAAELRYGPIALLGAGSDKSAVIVVMTRDRVYSSLETVYRHITSRLKQAAASSSHIPTSPHSVTSIESDSLPPSSSHRPIVLVNEDDDNTLLNDSLQIRIPSTCDALQSILDVIPLQLLSYHMCVAKGLNPDPPELGVVSVGQSPNMSSVVGGMVGGEQAEGKVVPRGGIAVGKPPLGPGRNRASVHFQDDDDGN